MALFLPMKRIGGNAMTNRVHHRTDFRPQLVAERKPLRPVQVAATRQPVKITKPFSLEGELVEAGTLPTRRIR